MKPFHELGLSWRYVHIFPSYLVVWKPFQLTVSEVFLFHIENDRRMKGIPTCNLEFNIYTGIKCLCIWRSAKRGAGCALMSSLTIRKRAWIRMFAKF